MGDQEATLFKTKFEKTLSLNPMLGCMSCETGEHITAMKSLAQTELEFSWPVCFFLSHVITASKVSLQIACRIFSEWCKDHIMLFITTGNKIINRPQQPSRCFHYGNPEINNSYFKYTRSAKSTM